MISLMITSKTGCMLRDTTTGEMLPILSLEFTGGGAVSDIITLEDGISQHYDADVLETHYLIERIECRRFGTNKETTEA